MAEGTHDPAAEHLRKLLLVTDAALANLSLDELLDEVLVRIRDILEADTAACLMLDEQSGELVARAAKGLEEEVERGVRSRSAAASPVGSLPSAGRSRSTTSTTPRC